MSHQLEADILAASQPLRVPGGEERRVLASPAVERLSGSAGVPRWEVEAAAVELGIVPLHFLRNQARFSPEAQARLIRARVVLIGGGPVLARAGELLAANGVGRIDVLSPQPDGAASEAASDGDKIAAAVRNRNASSEVLSARCEVKSGRGLEPLKGADAVLACLRDSMEEQLLQFACRRVERPLVLAGIEERRGQATTVLPGDPGVALVYKPRHPHLEPQRTGADLDGRAVLMVGAWLEEQGTRLILGEGELLRGRLLYADLETGEMTEYPLV
ncbi:MAG: ThiF family adenylyltransferase [Armatimonadota bacterium]